MKIVFTGICFLVFGCTTMAQSKPGDVNALLKKTSARYKSMKTIRAQFNVQFENLKDKSNTLQKAQLIVSGKKFRLALEE